MRVFNGTLPIIDPRPHAPVCIDACTEAGAGFYDGEWFHVRWENWPGALERHINYKTETWEKEKKKSTTCPLIVFLPTRTFWFWDVQGQVENICAV